MNTTATQSNQNPVRSKAAAYYKFRFGELRVNFFLNVILSAILFPIIAIAFAQATHAAEGTGSVISVAAIVVIAPLVVIAMLFNTYSAGIAAFSHLHTKNISDMHLSLPLNHKQRFWGNYAAGLTVLVAPYAVMALIGLFIFRVFTVSSVLKGIFDELNVDGYGEFTTQFLVPIFFTGLLVIFFLYNLTIFCNSICGSGFTAAFLPLLISAVVPILILTLSTLALVRARGIISISSFLYTITTPVGFLFGSLTLFDQPYPVFTVTKPNYVIPILLINAGLLIASFYLSKGVKAENIGKDFLYKSAYNIQQLVVLLCLVSIFGSSYFGLDTNPTVMLMGIIVSIAIFFGGHIIHYKGLSNIKSGIVKYIAFMTAALLICATLVMGRGFGTEKYIPSEKSIEAVMVEYSGTYSDDDYMLAPKRRLKDSLKTSGEERKFIRKVDLKSSEWGKIVDQTRTLHKDFIENIDYASYSNEDVFFSKGDWFYVRITYLLSNGREITREYDYSGDDVKKLIDEGVIKAEKINYPAGKLNEW